MFTTLAKGYGPAVLIGIICAAVFGLPLWQTLALIWIAGAPLTLILGPLQLPTLYRSTGIAPALSGRTARTQGAGY